MNRNRENLRITLVALAATTLILLAAPIHAQTYTVLHNFTDGLDGTQPRATLTRDQAGNFYGTTASSVFKLSLHGGAWVLTPLYHFSGHADGQSALAPVVIGRDGALYGTTLGGGYIGGPYCRQGGCGVVYKVQPPPTRPASVLTPWLETVIHPFIGPPSDGDQPAYGGVIFDAAGNLYGTTNFGGSGYGAVFEMSPSADGWTETLIYGDFTPDNGYPLAGVVMDAAGNLYGTTMNMVYELSPSAGGWTLTTLHTFTGGVNGGLVYAGLTFDAHGNLFGATSAGGTGDGGVVFELTPSGGTWTYNVVYNLPGGPGPYDALTFDAAGNLYGTTMGGGLGDAGTVFKLTPGNGSWIYTALHNFTFQTEWFPYGGVNFDANGNLYGTTSDGGADGSGVVWEITP